MIILVIGMIVIYKQLEYVQNSNLGFDKEHLIYLPMNKDVRMKYEPFKNDLLKNSDILNVSASSSLPFWGTDIATEDVNWEGKIPGEDFLKRLKLRWLKGEIFHENSQPIGQIIF